MTRFAKLTRIWVAWACLWTAPLSAQSLIHTGTFNWETRAVVGLSALELSEDGQDFVAIGDRGWYLAGQLRREDGQVTDVTIDSYLPLLGTNGLPVSARRLGDWSDAEGLAIAPDGTMWVSFERWARVVRYQGPQDSGTVLPKHPDFPTYRENRQLESVALHPDGTLYAFAEAARRDGFAVYAYQDGQWAVTGHIAASKRYAIVGADFDSAGRLFLLERRHFLGQWWQNRIRVLDVDRPESTTILWTSGMGDYDNLEGLAVWGTPTQTRLTVVADNNGAVSEISQILDFELVD